MPTLPIGLKNRKGRVGSYYALRDYTAVNPEFGTLTDFRRIVDQAHALVLKVIFDWVANHTAWDHPWTVRHPAGTRRKLQVRSTPTPTAPRPRASPNTGLTWWDWTIATWRSGPR